jgi:hypothetical protein
MRRKTLIATVGLLLVATTAILAQEPYLNSLDTPDTGSSSAWLCTLLIGMILGVTGQIARSVVGLKKEMDNARPGDKKWDWFNMRELLVSLLLGAAAGILSAVLMIGTQLNREFLLACVAAGYAGSDFIQGFMQKEMPATSGNPKKEAAAPGGGTADPTGNPAPKTETGTAQKS